VNVVTLGGGRGRGGGRGGEGDHGKGHFCIECPYAKEQRSLVFGGSRDK